MYNRVRVAVASLVVVVMCVISSTGTVSYFTDSKGTTNNFTVGNASTTLAVYGSVSPSKQLLSAESHSPVVNETEISFHPQAENTGNIPVYQRFRVVIPIALEGVVTLGLTSDSCMVTGTETCSNSNKKFTVIYNPSVEVNNVPTYAEYYIVSNDALAVGDSTYEWPTDKIVFDNFDNVDMETLAEMFTCTNDNNNCNFGISVYSDVIQTTGFTEGAVKAFESFTAVYN